ncbi:hypothetical protein [Moraxella lacunata]|uniref:hypothetical protein n=1 Tax=Moraxella lacunata TaxID=477 RepID=UPI001560FC37|nr:hypothetical protein [Moraxella lacunata]MBE9578342.1 hypothetical protein [Moraxella sp. K1664]
MQDFDRLTPLDDIGLEERMYETVYTSWYQRNHTQPDHVFYGYWNQFRHQYENTSSWSLTTLSSIATYYFDVGDKTSIKTHLFDEWQTYLSNHTALPVLANKIANFTYESAIADTFDLLHLLKDRLGYRPYLTPDEPLLDNFIQRFKLYETHMHLNGTSSFEHNWYDALLRPKAFIHNLQKSHHSSKRVKLLYATHPYLKSPMDYHKLIVLARHLREYLLAWRDGHDDETKNIQKNISTIITDGEITHAGYFKYEQVQFGVDFNDAVIKDGLLDISAYDSYIKELHWHIQIQQKLMKHPKHEYGDIAYLLYIVCMNAMQRLFVQRDDQYGFDNFQKLADDEARELVEQKYTDRFFQLHGPYHQQNGDMAVIEGRFAPKATINKNIDIIKRILTGFLEYSNAINHNQNEIDADDLATLIDKVIDQPTKLYLIAHFIKKPKTKKENYEFAELRKDLWLKAHLLIMLVQTYPKLRRILQAVDAASNELETPPEVLAPVFRYCRHQGIKHFTYHAGEDFEHLIGGIRAIHEAIEFLPLQNGDRIGHATAIGISPKLWLNNTPEGLILKKGDWLDNLLFVWQMILSHHLKGFNLLELENHIYQLYAEIYDGIYITDDQGNDIGATHLNLNLIYLAYTYRYLDPEKVSIFLNKENHQLYEKEYLHLRTLNTKALRLAHITWFNDIVRARRDLLFQTNMDFSAKQLLKLQQCIQKSIADKKIVIESLPTSNVRISHYKSLHEHHIFRWLHIKGRAVDGDARMRIVLGSDDPGIFATDLRGEYYHIFCSLKSHFGYGEEKALDIIKKLHENSQVYHFN